MAEIIYKKGCEGQNKLSCIKGIEIDLLNGQKALIYPKYWVKPICSFEHIISLLTPAVTEIEALKVTDTAFTTKCLFDVDSPAAQWVSQFKYGKYRNFYLPSLIAAMEIQHQKKNIDALAETIEGANLLRDFTSVVWSCSRYSEYSYWCANGSNACTDCFSTSSYCLVVPTILYNE